MIVEGFKRFAFQVDDLAKNFDEKVMSRALSKGASVFRREIRREIRQLAISRDGQRALSRGLFIQRHRPRDGRVTVSVRFRIARPSRADIAAARKDGLAVRPEWDPFFWHWIEYGTAVRATKRGHARGAVKATPFVAPAIERAEEEAYRAIQDELDKAIDEAIARSGWG